MVFVFISVLHSSEVDFLKDVSSSLCSCWNVGLERSFDQIRLFLNAAENKVIIFFMLYLFPQRLQTTSHACGVWRLVRSRGSTAATRRLWCAWPLMTACSAEGEDWRSDTQTMMQGGVRESTDSLFQVGEDAKVSAAGEICFHAIWFL